MNPVKIFDAVQVMRLKAYGYNPEGLHEFDPRSMPSPMEIAKQAEIVGVKVGDIRYGVLDTGKPVVEDERLSLVGFVEKLEQQGWVIVAVHKRSEAKPGKPGQQRMVTEMIMVKGGERRPLLTDESIMLGREFFNACFGGVTVWQNMRTRRPEDVPNVTVNLSGRMKLVPDGTETLEMEFVETPVSTNA